MLLKGFVLGLLGGDTVIWMSIISVQAESVSTRKTLTPSRTSSWTSLIVV